MLGESREPEPSRPQNRIPGRGSHPGHARDVEDLFGLLDRPLTARSVVASVLLGNVPPELPGRLLVAWGGLFGMAEGTVRTALSRMVASGELEAHDGRYRLAGSLESRRVLQDWSRRPVLVDWNGDWTVLVVTAERRSPRERAEFRTALARIHFAELREGAWCRPANLSWPDVPDEVRSAVESQTVGFVGSPTTDAQALVERLFPLGQWRERAALLIGEMDDTFEAFEGDDPDSLATGFVVAAATLSHVRADPNLPSGLVGPEWPGTPLRRRYEAYEAGLQRAVRRWFRRTDASSAT